MNWLDPKDAPKGHYVPLERTVKGKVVVSQQHVLERIIGCANGHSCETYWILPGTTEGGKKGRWHKFNQGVELDGWQPMPEAL